MDVFVRFAPSPTGLIHVGNVKAAVVNWLFAKSRGGRFLLRSDDTDQERSRADYETAIETDLTWLGLEWDVFARQSERMDRYDAAADRLRDAGRLYACYENAEELELKRNLQRAQGRPPVYDREGLRLTDAERQAFEQQGRRPHWRFLLNPGRVGWQDLVRGEVDLDAESLSDPVLIREDGRPLYTLSSVVDDGEMGITHVIRGEDHVANTAVQVQLFEALGFAVPEFGHFALLVDVDGGPLSKRLGSLTIAGLREEGYEAMALNSLLARLGTADPVEPYVALDPLIDTFDIAKFGRAAARFDVQELAQLNARILHQLSFDEVADRLNIADADASFWEAVRANLTKLSDAREWWQVITGPIDPPPAEDDDFLQAAAQHLPAAPLDEQSWQTWTQAVKQETGRKGKQLFAPLRRALTGRDHGPEMRLLLPLIGREQAAARLCRD